MAATIQVACFSLVSTGSGSGASEGRKVLNRSYQAFGPYWSNISRKMPSTMLGSMVS